MLEGWLGQIAVLRGCLLNVRENGLYKTMKNWVKYIYLA